MAELPPILALDLATRTGWAYLAPGADRPESGALQLSDTGPASRVVSLETWLWPRLAPLAAGRGVLAYESPALVQNRAAPFRVGCHLEAAVLRMAHAWRVTTVLTATAPEVKAYATGKGNADKDAMVAAMRSRWEMPELEDDNRADALALLAFALRALKTGEVELLPSPAEEGAA